ncbi:MAG: cytochrome-c peroxidase, partial [Gammaproteobacteria bacterium]|nr:cytochrome-c peroxidase [Gammaproteobacteria bacterium]
MRIKKLLIYICAFTLTVYNVSVSAGSDLEGNWGVGKNIGSTHAFGLKRRERRLDRKLKRLIKRYSLTGNPLKNRTTPVPDINSPIAQLGMELFFSKTLGGDEDSACVTCHHPALGGGDNLSLPIGVEADEPDWLGLGRTNAGIDHKISGSPIPRNAPTTFNIIAWDQFMFHDGRVESLDKTPGNNGVGVLGIRTPDSGAIDKADLSAGENLVQAQARFPVTSPEEMKGFEHSEYSNQATREMLADRLKKDEEWVGKFEIVFDDKTITEQKVSFAIGEYERSQVFIETPWKQYIEGDKDALSVSAKKGAVLFFQP